MRHSRSWALDPHRVLVEGLTDDLPRAADEDVAHDLRDLLEGLVRLVPHREELLAQVVAHLGEVHVGVLDVLDLGVLLLRRVHELLDRLGDVVPPEVIAPLLLLEGDEPRVGVRHVLGDGHLIVPDEWPDLP